jgi:hypothetical protein
MYAIFDIDNCISDDEWRIEKIKEESSQLPKDELYREYHALAPKDKAKNLIYIKDDHADDDIIMITSRPEEYRAQTEEWLKKNGVKYKKLLMRPKGNHQPSAELKIKLFDSLGIEPEEVTCAYDDRSDIVRAYRKHGIWAVKLAIHKFENLIGEGYAK